MSVLKGILSESKGYYLALKRKIEDKLKRLPKGSIKERNIYGSKYYYLQYRSGSKVSHKYLGKKRPEGLLGKIKTRRALRAELKKVNEALRVLMRSEGRRRG